MFVYIKILSYLSSVEKKDKKRKKVNQDDKQRW